MVTPPSYTYTVLLSVSEALKCTMDIFQYGLYTLGCVPNGSQGKRERFCYKMITLKKEARNGFFPKTILILYIILTERKFLKSRALSSSQVSN